MSMADLREKVILITGATNGIGKAAAQQLALMKPTLVLVGRNPERTERTVAELKTASGNPHIHGLVADLSVMAQVHDLAEQFKRRFDRLDVLLNNAGAVFEQRQRSADGFELTFATNHLNYFLLTNRLLDVLKASAPARVVNVSSDAHRIARQMDFDNLDGQRWGMMGFQAYSLSKLANVLFTRELARRLEGSGVTANALHPGSIASGFGRNNSSLFSTLFFKTVGPLMMKSPEVGARTLVYLAASPEVEGVNGGYFVDCKPVQPSKAAQDDTAARRLWEISEKLVGQTVGA
jgi:NAD(P)-dependent dehydrogenase (short-subunit alcohol dehydrogenase family)